jgi:hypothetical protein
MTILTIIFLIALALFVRAATRPTETTARRVVNHVVHGDPIAHHPITCRCPGHR